MNVVLFGSGNVCKYWLENKKNQCDKVLAIVDNNNLLWGKKIDGYDYTIVSPSEIANIDYDVIYVCNDTRYVDILFQLYEMHVELTKISFDAISMFRVREFEEWEIVLKDEAEIEKVYQRSAYYLKSKININELFPTNNKIEKKLKIGIWCNHSRLLNSIESLIFAFEDMGADITLLMRDNDLDSNKAFYNFCEENGFKGRLDCDYDIAIEKPDILVSTSFKPQTIERLGGMEKVKNNTKYMVATQFEQTNAPDGVLDDEVYKSISEISDRVIVSPNIYEYVKKDVPNALGMLNPKLDIIYEKQNANNIPSRFRKLKGKRTTLFGVSHGIDWDKSRCFASYTAFDVYIKYFFDYYRQHPEEGLIIRLHHCQIDEYLKWQIWNESDVESFKNYINQSSNIVLDEAISHAEAIAFSDALICEENCGMMFSYLPTKKPIGVLYRSKDDINGFNLNIVESYYKLYDWYDVEKFLSDIALEKDVMYEKRMKTLKELIPSFDGRNGVRMAEFIVDEYKRLYE